jgi:hypothetical protein
MNQTTQRPGEISHGVTVEEHHHFQRSLVTDSYGRDEIDREIDDLDEIDRELDEQIEVDPLNREPSSRKSDNELGKLLAILDSLPAGKDADEL